MGGAPKALLRLPSGETFLARLVRHFRAVGAADVVVVTGHEADRVAEEALRCGARPVHNPSYADGQFSSLCAGLDATPTGDLDALWLALVDAPGCSVATLRALAATFETTRAPVVRAVDGTAHGHPVLLSAALLPALRAADPSEGAKPIVRAYASAAGDVSVHDPAAFLDSDTPEAYARLCAFVVD